MPTAIEAKITNMLLDCLPSTLDSYVLLSGFTRAPESLEYMRQVDEGQQELQLIFVAQPAYEPGALAYLLPQVRVVLPELNRRVLEMIPDIRSLSGANGVTFFEQLQNAAPRVARPAATNWFIYDIETARSCLASMQQFVERWSMPFLNRNRTIASVVDGFEHQDECLPHDRRFWLFVVAAYTLLNKSTEAMQVLESKFGRAKSRREYAKVFEYVNRLTVIQ